MFIRKAQLLHKNPSGQALVETAIVMPVMLLLAMGTWQLMLLANARIMVEYAAHNACRAGIVNNGDDVVMADAAMASVLPLYCKRTDTIENLLDTNCWERMRELNHIGDGGGSKISQVLADIFGHEVSGGLTSLVNVTTLNPTARHFQAGKDELDFDDVLDYEHHAKNLLSARVTVMVPLKIPVFNKVLWELYMVRKINNDVRFSRVKQDGDGKEKKAKNPPPLTEFKIQAVQGTKVIIGGGDGTPIDIKDAIARGELPATVFGDGKQLQAWATRQTLQSLAEQGAYLIPIESFCNMQMQSNFYFRENLGGADLHILD